MEYFWISMGLIPAIAGTNMLVLFSALLAIRNIKSVLKSTIKYMKELKMEIRIKITRNTPKVLPD